MLFTHSFLFRRRRERKTMFDDRQHCVNFLAEAWNLHYVSSSQLETRRTDVCACKPGV